MEQSIVERIATFEVRLNTLEEQYKEINTKLDKLIALKNKGAGAFWLATTLFGSSMLIAVYFIIDLIKGTGVIHPPLH